MSEKKNENDINTDASWKKRIKKPVQEEPEQELHETEPFVDVKFNDIEREPYNLHELHDSETPAFVNVHVNNAEMPERICKKCGHQVKEENLNFCPKCGNRLKRPRYNFRR